MYSACGSAVLTALGFPIRASADHGLFSASPRLIAAVHALLRLLVPRHPPCALLILTVIRHLSDPKVLEAPGDTRCRWRSSRSPPRWHGCAVFKVREEARSPDWGARSLKTQQHAPAGTREACLPPPPPGQGHGGSRPRRAAGARSGRRIGTGSSSTSAVCGGGRCRRSSPGASLERR
jgi:hypothetical protein